MGMFDEFKFDPNDVSVATSEGYTSAPMQLAYQGSGMMATGLGKLAGFKDEEDLLQEIYETSDFETKEGRNEAIRRIRAVSPEKADEISKQILAEAQTEANIVNTELATESALIDRAKALYTGSLQLKFQNDASVNGERAAIAMWLAKNLPNVDASKVTTSAEAASLINDEIDTGASTFITSLNNYVAQRQDAYVTQGVYEKAGLTFEGSDSIDTTSTTAETLPELTDPAVSTTDVPKYAAEEIKTEDSDFTRVYKRNKAKSEIRQVLGQVRNSLVDLMPEMFMNQTDKTYENAEDAVGDWIGGQVGDSSAAQWFLTQSPEELMKFRKDPVKYYKKNRVAIEGSTTYDSSLDNNQDLFASIPYDLEN